MLVSFCLQHSRSVVYFHHMAGGERIGGYFYHPASRSEFAVSLTAVDRDLLTIAIDPGAVSAAYYGNFERNDHSFIPQYPSRLFPSQGDIDADVLMRRIKHNIRGSESQKWESIPVAAVARIMAIVADEAVQDPDRQPLSLDRERKYKRLSKNYNAARSLVGLQEHVVSRTGCNSEESLAVLLIDIGLLSFAQLVENRRLKPHDEREEISLDEKHWRDFANCVRVDPDELFVEGEVAQQRAAERICSGCRVKTHCLIFALDNDEHHGVWGGLSQGERLRLLSKNEQRALLFKSDR
jgi:hypothetical protein